MMTGSAQSGRSAFPTAFVMNMFYTGLGIARSLGEMGAPVVGLTSQRGVAGNFTRYAKTLHCPDSRNEPEALLSFLLRLGQEKPGGIIFPTRDDDVIFLDQRRQQLEAYFRLVIPPSNALQACLSKWDTYIWAQKAGVATPKCWLIESDADLQATLPDVQYPCVLKPLSSHLWRLGANWNIVRGRKAIELSSEAELLAEYAAVRDADCRAIVQVMIPGPDDALVIAACYMDRQSNMVAAFNTQKLLQEPEGFGTGCIVSTANAPELFPPTEKLLREIGYQGIAEVEYKWDAARREYSLIEVNPRPWDQHRLAKACGVDLMQIAYCEHAGLPLPGAKPQFRPCKWIADDTFFRKALQLLWRRDSNIVRLFRLAKGSRMFAIWSVKDPLPLAAHAIIRVIPTLVKDCCKRIAALVRQTTPLRRKEVIYAGKVSQPKNIS